MQSDPSDDSCFLRSTPPPEGAVPEPKLLLIFVYLPRPRPCPQQNHLQAAVLVSAGRQQRGHPDSPASPQTPGDCGDNRPANDGRFSRPSAALGAGLERTRCRSDSRSRTPERDADGMTPGIRFRQEDLTENRRRFRSLVVQMIRENRGPLPLLHIQQEMRSRKNYIPVGMTVRAFPMLSNAMAQRRSGRARS